MLFVVLIELLLIIISSIVKSVEFWFKLLIGRVLNFVVWGVIVWN